MAGCSGTSRSPADGPAASGVVSDIIIPFQLTGLLYAPPGGKSLRLWWADRRLTADWQAVDSNGIRRPAEVDSADFSDAAVGDAGLRLTTTTQLDVSYHSDQPTGLSDMFGLVLDIPAQQTAFSDSVQLKLDHRQGKGALLGAISLVALAESWPNTSDILASEPWPQAQADLITSFITAEAARNLLLLDPNFSMTQDGHVALRSWDDVRQVVEQPGYQDRFVPEHYSVIAGGNPLGNTLEVPDSPPPGYEGQTEVTKEQLTADRFASLGSSGSRTPTAFQSPVVVRIPTYGSDGLPLASGYLFQETFQRMQVAVTPTVPLDDLTIEMTSPCLTGLVDIYVDTAFGVYLPVPRSAGFIPESYSNALWYAIACRGNPQARPYLMACDSDGDCGSKTCTNSVCAPPACSPNCAPGEGCGGGYPYPPGDCASYDCEVGICVAASYGMPCSVDSDCATQNCSQGLCGTPTCSPHCGPQSGCAVGGDCESGGCFAGTCL